MFASHLIEDLRLPFNAFYKEVVAQIKRHIEEAHVIEDYAAHLADEDSMKMDDDRDWWERRRVNKKRKFEGPGAEFVVEHEDQPQNDETLGSDEEEEEEGEGGPEEDHDEPMSVEDFAIAARKMGGLGLQDDELRVLIRVCCFPLLRTP